MIPSRKDRPVKLDLPKIQSAQDIINVMGLIVENVGKGAFDPDEATIQPGTKVTWTNYTKDRQMVSSGDVPEVVETEANVKLLTISVE